MTGAPASSPAVSGRFEVPFEKFSELARERAADVQQLDLKAVFPDILAGVQHVPRLVGRVWRRGCDEAINENKGIYSCKDDMAVHVLFFELTAAVAKAKVGLIREKLPEILKAAKSDESILDAPLPKNAKALQQEKQPQGDPNLSRLLKEGLCEGATPEMARLWAQRTLQGMVTSPQKTPLTRDMMELAGKSDAAWSPLWSAAGGMIVGSAAAVRSGIAPAQQGTGEHMRQDFAALFASVFQLYSLHAKGQGGTTGAPVFVPARASTLSDKDGAELYFGFLRRVAPEVRKNLIVQVRGVPKDVSPPSLVAAIETLGQFARAIVFETGLLTLTSFARQYPRLHAAGFDSADAHVGGPEQVRLLKKFADHYKAAGLRLFVTHVAEKGVLDCAAEKGFTYISGPVVKAAQKSLFLPQKLAAAELGGS